MTTTIFHGLLVDTPTDPFTGGTLRAEQAALTVTDGVIRARGTLAEARNALPDAPVVALAGVVLPGLVDTHVHFPQLRIIGGLGLPLLDWLERCALPEEARMADPGYAARVAGEFTSGLLAAGTTTALVFGAHYASATDALFRAAEATGLRMTAGLVVGDRHLRPDLHTTPERAAIDSAELISRWHGRGSLRYAVTPRFALSATEELLRSCAEVLALAPDLFVTSHVNENPAEVAAVEELFGTSYTEAYHRAGLLGGHTVLAHNVHAGDAELALLAETGTAVSHCPSSNSSLGSGLFPMRRHLEAGVRLALGSDVGGGTGLSLFKEGLQAYFHQQLRPDGVPLTAAHLLHLATRAGAAALDLPGVGHLGVGASFDAIEVDPPAGTTLAAVLAHAPGPDEALAAIFAGGTSADISRVWTSGVSAHTRASQAA
ncbi:guanine deaminase [Pseudactinotalea sp. HY160]|uniref:guanine deaminase n=1 Tax=Pseudactinotalea sp. HY160 TaxID=2654490 RepID=UPI00128C8D2F|nr:guanine deaminase [Pseudactinotalea sp. HY160]MPV48704.1 guanine deaminase [Pseudactinotalea sp. HY160]